LKRNDRKKWQAFVSVHVRFSANFPHISSPFFFQLESYPENGIRLLRMRDVTASRSGEICLQVKHPQAEFRRIPTPRSYTSLLVLPAIRGNSSSSSLAARSCILTRPEDCTALIGGHVRLSVRYEPFPGTKVIWYKAVSSGAYPLYI